MTWKEAQAAFKQQVPVIYHASLGGDIICTRIAEISLRCSRDGKIIRIVGGMDRNENCLYHAEPERFSLSEGLVIT